MRKTKIILLSLGVLVLTGCSQEEVRQNTVDNPVLNPAANTKEMLDLKNQAQKNIQDSVNKGNEKLNNALNENGMNDAQNALGDNSALVKQYAFATVKTSLGDIKVKLNSDKTPVTAGNFLKLSKAGFYDGTKFHRVIKGFMIQGGDPNSKGTNKATWGTGGPNYRFDDELTGQEKYPQGTLAMANAGPDTNGSQFFIVTASPEAPLPPSYTVFGSVVSGLDTALKIENVKTGANDRPVEDVVIKSIEPLEK
ncbi:MAG: peptidylprolyl isomerase [Parcubacteria group bacterium]